MDHCPLILDLDGDGVETDAVALFDVGGDGFAELTHWAGSDDGMLVRDLNGNGAIDDGSELLGERTVLSSGERASDGFAALSDLDANGDGAVDSLDAGWSDLRVLRQADSDGDGEKDGFELSTLESLGIARLNVSRVASDKVDAQGNEHRLAGSYEKADGSAGDLSDVWLRRLPFVSAYSGEGIPEHGERISALPDLEGSGRVYNLRDAMALDDAGLLRPPFYGDWRGEPRTLRELAEAFASERDAEAREDLAERILLRWAGAENAEVSDFTPYGDFRYSSRERMATMEAFMGEQWRAGLGRVNTNWNDCAIIRGWRSPRSSTSE